MLDDGGSRCSNWERIGKGWGNQPTVPSGQDVHLDGTTFIAAKTVWGALHGLETMSQLVDFNFATGAAQSLVWGRAGESPHD